jgi:hypothetical protein
MEAPSVEEERQERADSLLALPIANGGFGITPASILAPIAFATSLIAMMGDSKSQPTPLLGLLPDITSAYERIATLLGTTVEALATDKFLSAILPADPHALLSGAFAMPDSPVLNPLVTRHAQGILVRECARLDRLRMLSAHNVMGMRADLRRGDDPSSHTTVSDVVHMHLILSRSQWTRILRADLHDRYNRVEPAKFVHAARYHLGLPPLLRPNLAHEAVGGHGQANMCCAGHDVPQHIDPTGDHAVACLTTRKSRAAMHNNFRSLVARFAREAGCDVEVEPNTQDVLYNAFSADECRLMFCRNPTKADRTRASEVRGLINKVHSASTMVEKEAARAKIKEIAVSAPGRLVGLRLDIVLTSPDGLASPAYVDVGLIHPTSASVLSKQAKFVQGCQAARLQADPRATVNDMSGMNSAALTMAENKKAVRYAPIIEIAATLSGAKNRPTPVFYPALMTHSGEISNSAIKLIEWLSAAYRHQTKAIKFMDGITPKRRVGLFRQRLKDNLMALVANGFGRTLKEAGMDRSIVPPSEGVNRS